MNKSEIDKSFNNKIIDVNCHVEQSFQELLTFLQL